MFAKPKWKEKRNAVKLSPYPVKCSHLKQKSITSSESTAVRQAVTLCNGGLWFLLWQTKGKLFKWHQVSFHLWKGMTSTKEKISRLKGDFLFTYSSCRVWSGMMKQPDSVDKILSKQINEMPIPHLIKLTGWVETQIYPHFASNIWILRDGQTWQTKSYQKANA